MVKKVKVSQDVIAKVTRRGNRLGKRGEDLGKKIVKIIRWARIHRNQKNVKSKAMKKASKLFDKYVTVQIKTSKQIAKHDIGKVSDLPEDARLDLEKIKAKHMKDFEEILIDALGAFD